MRYPPEHKEQTRQHIIAEAARLFRENGPESTGITEIMKAAGLTIGGFYRHFESKDELFRLALEQSLRQTLDLLRAKESSTTGEAWIRKAAAIYLHPAHVENVGGGCPLPMLTAEVARRGDAKGTFETLLAEIIDLIEDRMPQSEKRRQRAWGFLATLVGGLLLARGTGSQELGVEILESCRSFLDP